MGAALDPRVDRAVGPLAIGGALGMAVMVHRADSTEPASTRPAPSGPTLVSGEWGSVGKFVLAYVLAPILGSLAAAATSTSTSSSLRGRRDRRGWSRSAEAAPGRGLDSGPMRRVTFSRNFTLSLSRTCQCYCKYCAFATHRAHLYAPDEVERLLDDAARRGVKELLVLTGEKPEVNAEVAGAWPSTGTGLRVLRGVGVRAARWSAGCCPTRTSGVCTRRRTVPPASGHRLPGADAGVGEPGPGGAPGLADQASRAPPGHDPGRRRAAHPLHERDPRGDRRVAGGAGRRRSRRWPSCTGSTGTSRR